MFSNLIFRNSQRSRKENALFFSSMVISIVAFYMILSISTQDVMIFLREMESEAVQKLLLIIPAFYGFTLGILFFLIYFAYKYQFEHRRHEFGVYLMHGMQRSKLFIMLLAEDLLSSLLSLIIGLPIAIVLSEIISLVTAKLVGMGIMDHRISLSFPAIIWTLLGFLIIKLLALLILSGKICSQEIGSLLSKPTNVFKKQKKPVIYALSTICGILMLISAYMMDFKGNAWNSLGSMAACILLGSAGTILFFYGIRILIAWIVRKNGGHRQLHVFTFRQIQENVIHQSTSMAISSLMILAALCFFGAGLGIVSTNTPNTTPVIDYTFESFSDDDASKTLDRVKAILKDNHLEDQFSELFETRVGYIRTAKDMEHAFTMDTVIKSVLEFPDSEDKDTLLGTLRNATFPHIICLSDYNKILELAGQAPLTLEANEVAVYMDLEFLPGRLHGLFNQVLNKRPKARIDQNPVYITGEVQTTNFVADHTLTLSFALIVPDGLFFYHTKGMYEPYVNALISDQARAGHSLLTAYSVLNKKLSAINFYDMGIDYECYLKSVGRQLFFAVAAGYITIYLAIVFLVVANTIIGVQFLMNQQKTGRRYLTLIRLGATYEILCQSARKQISWFMGLPVLVAAINSLFAVRALYNGILTSRVQDSIPQMLFVSAAVILLLCVVEWIYMWVVKRSSDKYLLTLLNPQREE